MKGSSMGYSGGGMFFCGALWMWRPGVVEQPAVLLFGFLAGVCFVAAVIAACAEGSK